MRIANADQFIRNKMQYSFRKAKVTEVPTVWEILKHAINSRKMDGSTQWQDGYPNKEAVITDIENNHGYVLAIENTVIGYCAVLINDEPEYAKIEGKWQTNSDFVVFHRVAIAEKYLGQGWAKKMIGEIEKFAVNSGIYSVKADTNFDNMPMKKIFENTGYVFCGVVYFRGSPRDAYEKVLLKRTK